MYDRRHARQTRHTIGPDRRDVFETPCLGNSAPFDALLHHTRGPANRAAARDANAICAGCPIQQKCHADAAKAGEEWYRSYRVGLEMLRRRPDIDAPQQPPREPDELRAMHSRYELLRKRGEEIPADVRDGERQYQARRKRAARARTAA